MKNIVRLLCLVFLVSIASVPAFSKQSLPAAQIKGQVKDDASNDPLMGVNVMLRGTVLGSATDTRGRYIIERVPPGKYTIIVSAIGYARQEKTVQVAPNETIELNFSLEETVIQTDGVTITASRYQQSITEIPVSMSLVSAKEILGRSSTRIDQALQYVPGVNVLENGQVAIRGSSGFNFGMGSRVLVLLNGNPMMSGDNWSINWDSFATVNVKQIEVMKGSGSALYGSSAMGGVINIITEEPEEGNHFHIQTTTGLYNPPSYSEWEWTDEIQHFESTAVKFSTYLGPVSTTLSSSYKTTTSYRENDDKQIFNFMASLSCPLKSNLRFDLTTGYRNKDGGFFVYWKSLRNPYGNGSDPIGTQTRSTAVDTYVFPSLTYVYNGRISLLLKGRYHKIETEDHLRSVDSESGQDAGQEPVQQDDAFRFSRATVTGGEAQLNCQVAAQGIMVVGADFQRTDINSIQYGTPQVTQASYYVQYEQRLWDLFKVTLGTRYDLESGNDIDTSGELSRKLGINFSFSTDTHLRFSYAEGFRTPAVGERYVSTYTGGLQVSPNPDLLPEKSVSAEVGVRQTVSQSAHMDLAVFYSTYDDLIEPQLDTNPDGAVVVRFKNVAKARNIGLDLSYKTDWWSRLASTRVGYTYLDGKELSPGDDYGKPLKYRSRHTFYTSTDVNLLPFQAGVDFRYISKIERIDEYHTAYIKDIEQVVPTYLVALRVGFIKKHFSVRLKLDNLLQYNYLSAPANMGPPRTIVLQLSLKT